MAHDSGLPPGKQTSYKITSRRRSQTQPIKVYLSPPAGKGSSHANGSVSPYGGIGTQDSRVGVPGRNSYKDLRGSEDRPPVAHISRSRTHRQAPIPVRGENLSNEFFPKEPGNSVNLPFDDKIPAVGGAASSKYQQEYFRMWLDAQQKTLTDAMKKFGMNPDQVANTRASCFTKGSEDLQQTREPERTSTQEVAADPPVCVHSSSPLCKVTLKQRAKSEPAVSRKSLSKTFCKTSPPRVDFDRQDEILITPRALSEKSKSKVEGDMRPCRHPSSPEPKTRSKPKTSPNSQSAQKPRQVDLSPNSSCVQKPRSFDEHTTPPSTHKAQPLGIPISYSVQHDKHKNRKNKSAKSKSKISRKPMSQGISPTRVITPVSEFYEPAGETSDTCEKKGGFRFGSIQQENPKTSEGGQETPAKPPFVGNYAACYDLPRNRDPAENVGDYTSCPDPGYCPRICRKETEMKAEEGQRVSDYITCDSEIKATNQREVTADVPEVTNPCEKRCSSPFCKRRKSWGERRGSMKTGSILSGVVSAVGSQFQTIASRNMKFYGFPGMQGLFNPESTVGRLFYPQDNDECTEELEEGDAIKETASPTVTRVSVGSVVEQESFVSDRIRQARGSIHEEEDEEEQSNQGQVGILRTSGERQEEDALTSVRLSSTIQSTSSREGKGRKSTEDFEIESVVEIEGRTSKRSTIEDRSSKRSQIEERPSKRSLIEERSSKRSLQSSQRLSEHSAGRGSQASLHTVESAQSARSQKPQSISRLSAQSGLKSESSKHEDYLHDVSEGEEVSVGTSGLPETLPPRVEDTLSQKPSTTKRISTVSNNLSPSTSATLSLRVKAGPRMQEEEVVLSDEELKTVTAGSPRSQVSERRETTHKGERQIIVEAKQSFTISEKSESARDGPTSGVNESPARSIKRKESGAAQRIESSHSWSLSDGKLRYEAIQTVQQSEESDEQTIAVPINQMRQSRGSGKDINETQGKIRKAPSANDDLYDTPTPEIQQEEVKSPEIVQVTNRDSANTDRLSGIAQSNQEVAPTPKKSIPKSSITSLPASVKSQSRQEQLSSVPDSPKTEFPDLAVPSQASVKSGRPESRGSIQSHRETPPSVSAPPTPQPQDMATPSQDSGRITRPDSRGSLRSSGVTQPQENSYSSAASRNISVKESIRALIGEGTVSAHTSVKIHSRENTAPSSQKETLISVPESKDPAYVNNQSLPANDKSPPPGSTGFNGTLGQTPANEQFFSPQPSRGGSQQSHLTAEPPQPNQPPSQRTSQQLYLTEEPPQPSNPPSQRTSQQSYLTAEHTQPFQLPSQRTSQQSYLTPEQTQPFQPPSQRTSQQSYLTEEQTQLSHPPSQRTSQQSYFTAEQTQPIQLPSRRPSQQLHLTAEPTQPGQPLSRGASIQSYLTAEPSQRLCEDFQTVVTPEAARKTSSYHPGDCLHSLATLERSASRGSRNVTDTASIQPTSRPEIVQRTSITPEIRQMSGLSISEDMGRRDSFQSIARGEDQQATPEYKSRSEPTNKIQESQLMQTLSKKSLEIESYRRESILNELERRNPSEQLSSLPRRMSLISDADRVSLSKIEEPKFANKQLPPGGSDSRTIPDTHLRGDGTRPRSYAMDDKPSFPCRKCLALSDFQRSEICAGRSFELPEERQLQETTRPPSFEISKYERLTLLERCGEEGWTRTNKAAPAGAPSVHQVSIIMDSSDHRRPNCIQVCSTVGAPVNQVTLKTRDCSEFSSEQTDGTQEYGPRRGSTSSSEKERSLYQSPLRKRKQDPRSSMPAPEPAGNNYRSRDSNQPSTKRPISDINRAADPEHRFRKSAKEESAVSRNAPYYETTTTERSLSSHISEAGHAFRTEDEISRSDNVQAPHWPVRSDSKREDWRERAEKNDDVKPDDQHKFASKLSNKEDPRSPKNEWNNPYISPAEEPVPGPENPYNEHTDGYSTKRENLQTWTPSRSSPPRSKKGPQARSASGRDRKGEKCQMNCGEYHISVTSSNISTSPRSECSSVTVKLRSSEEAARKSSRRSDLDDCPDPARDIGRSFGGKQAPSSRPPREHDLRDNGQPSQRPPNAYSSQNTRYSHQRHADSGSAYKGSDYDDPQDRRDGDLHGRGRSSKTRRTEASRYGVNDAWAQRRSDFDDPDYYETEGRKSRLSRPSWGRQISSKQHSYASQPMCVTFPHELSETSSETFSRADRLVREVPQKTRATHARPPCELSHLKLPSRQGYSLSERDKVQQAQCNRWKDQLPDSPPCGTQRRRHSSKRSIVSLSSHSITGDGRARRKSRRRRELTSKETERYMRKLPGHDQVGHFSSSPARSSYSGSTSPQPTTDLGSISADELEYSTDNAQQLRELRYKQKCAEEELKKIRGRITFRYTDGPRCTNPTLEIQKGRLRMVASPTGAKCFKCDSSHHLGDGPGRGYNSRPTSNEMNGPRTRERRKCLEGFLSDSCMDRYEPESKDFRGRSWKLSDYCGDLSSLVNKPRLSNLDHGKSSYCRPRGINGIEGSRQSPMREHIRVYRVSPESRRSPYLSAHGNRSRCNSTSRDPDCGTSEVGEAIDQFQQIITPDCSGPVCSGDWQIGSDKNTASTKFCSYTARMATSAVSKISPQRSDHFATGGAGYLSSSEDISCVEELTLVNTQIFTCQRRSSQKGTRFLTSKTAGPESRTFKRPEKDPGPYTGQNQTGNAFTNSESASRPSNGLWSQYKGGEDSPYTTPDKGDDSSETSSETWHQRYDQHLRPSFPAPGQSKLHKCYYAQSGCKFPEDRTKNTNCSSNSQKAIDYSDENEDSGCQNSLERVDNFQVVNDGLAISVSPKTKYAANDFSHVNLGQPKDYEHPQPILNANCTSDQFLEMVSRTNQDASEYVSWITADWSSSPEKAEVVGNLENWLREIRDSSSQSSLCSDHPSRPPSRQRESPNTPSFNAGPPRSGHTPCVSSRTQSIPGPVTLDASRELSRSDNNVGDRRPRSESRIPCGYGRLQETTHITSAVTTTLTRLISSNNSKSQKSSRNTNREQARDTDQVPETMSSESNAGLILCRTELSCHQQLNFRVALSKRLDVRKEVVLVPLHYGAHGFSIAESNITENANTDFSKGAGLFPGEHSAGISERQNNNSHQPRVDCLSRKTKCRSSKETLQSPEKITGCSKDTILVYVISSGQDTNVNKSGFQTIIQSDADKNSTYSSHSIGTTKSTSSNHESDTENGTDNLVKGKPYHFFTKHEFFREFGHPRIFDNCQENRGTTRHRDKHSLKSSARDAVSECVNCNADYCQDRDDPTRQRVIEETHIDRSKSSRRNIVARTSIKQTDLSQLGTTFHGVAPNDEDWGHGKASENMLIGDKQVGSVCMNLNNSVLLQGDYEECQQLLGSSHLCHHARKNEARCDRETKSFYLHDENHALVPELPTHHGGTSGANNAASVFEDQRAAVKDHASKLDKITNSKAWWSSPPPLGLLDLAQDRVGSQDLTATNTSRQEQFGNSDASGTVRVGSFASPSLGDESHKQYTREMSSFKTSPISRSTFSESDSLFQGYDVSGSASNNSRCISSKVSSPDNDDGFRESPDFDRFINQPNPLGLLQGKLKVFFDTAMEKWTSPNLAKCSQMTGKNQQYGEPLNTMDNNNLAGTNNEFSLNSTLSEEENENGSGVLDSASLGSDSHISITEESVELMSMFAETESTSTPEISLDVPACAQDGEDLTSLVGKLMKRTERKKARRLLRRQKYASSLLRRWMLMRQRAKLQGMSRSNTHNCSVREEQPESRLESSQISPKSRSGEVDNGNARFRRKYKMVEDEETRSRSPVRHRSSSRPSRLRSFRKPEILSGRAKYVSAVPLSAYLSKSAEFFTRSRSKMPFQRCPCEEKQKQKAKTITLKVCSKHDFKTKKTKAKGVQVPCSPSQVCITVETSRNSAPPCRGQASGCEHCQPGARTDCDCDESPRRDRSPPKIERGWKDNSSDCVCHESPRRNRSPPKIEKRCKDSSDCGCHESPIRNRSPTRTETKCIERKDTNVTAGFLSCPDCENQQYESSKYKKRCQTCEQNIAKDCPCRKSETPKRTPSFHGQLLRSLAIKNSTTIKKPGMSTVRKDRSDSQDCKCPKPCSLTPIVEESRSKEHSCSDKSRSEEDHCTRSSFSKQENSPCHCSESYSRNISLSGKAPDCSRKSPKVLSPKQKKLSPPQRITIKVIKNSEAEQPLDQNKRKQASTDEPRSCCQTKWCCCFQCRATKKSGSGSEWTSKETTQQKHKVHLEKKLDEAFTSAGRCFERCRRPEVERHFACDEDRQYYLKWKDITEKYYGPSKVVEELPLKSREFKSLRGTDFMDSIKSRPRRNVFENTESGYRTRAVSWDNPTTSASTLRDERDNRPLPTRLHVERLRELRMPLAEPFYVSSPFVPRADDTHKSHLNMKSNKLKEAGKPSSPLLNNKYGCLGKGRGDSCHKSYVSGFDLPSSNQHPLPASPKSWKLESDPYLYRSTKPQFLSRAQASGYRPQVDTRSSRYEKALKHSELDADFFKYLESCAPFKSAFLRKEIEVLDATSAAQAMSAKKEEDLLTQYLGKRGNGFFRMARSCGASYRTSRNTNLNRTSGDSSEVTETSSKPDVIRHGTSSRAAEMERHGDHNGHRKDLSCTVPSNNLSSESAATAAAAGLIKEHNKANSNLNISLRCQSSEEMSQTECANQNESSKERDQNANNFHGTLDADFQIKCDILLMEEEGRQMEEEGTQIDLRAIQKDFKDSKLNFRNLRKDFADTHKYIKDTQKDFRDTQNDIRDTQKDYKAQQQDFPDASNYLFGNNVSLEHSLLNDQLGASKNQHMHETLDSPFYSSSQQDSLSNYCRKGGIPRSDVEVAERGQAKFDRTVLHNNRRTSLGLWTHIGQRMKRAGRFSMASTKPDVTKSISVSKRRAIARSIKHLSVLRFGGYQLRLSYHTFFNSVNTDSFCELLQFDYPGRQTGSWSYYGPYWSNKLVLEKMKSTCRLETSIGGFNLSRFWAAGWVSSSGSNADGKQLRQVRQKRPVEIHMRATISSGRYVGMPPVLELDTADKVVQSPDFDSRDSKVLQSPDFDPGDSKVLQSPDDDRSLAANNRTITAECGHASKGMWILLELGVIFHGCLQWATLVLDLIKKTRDEKCHTDIFQPVSPSARRVR